MLVRELGVGNPDATCGPDPGRIAGDLLAAHRGLGGVDDHRPASSLKELDGWEAGYRELVKANGGPFSNSPALETAFAADRQRLELNTAKADAEANKLLFVGLGAPMAAGAGAAAAPIAGVAVGEQFV